MFELWEALQSMYLKKDVTNKKFLFTMFNFSMINMKKVSGQLNESQNKTYQIGLEVASKILRHEINQDHTILKHMILDEIDSRKSQNIRMVEISEKAESLIFDLKNELELKGLTLQITNDEIDHIVFESDTGNYDLSISTQLKNIKRLFNTL
ncbi:MAG: hypothetical protein HGA35_06490 [Erysipelotrichaceae bacterium]|nr:hypothetical protein [Erysipelotrichaceae bacterium]